MTKTSMYEDSKKYEVSFTSKKINNVSIQLPNLTKRSIQDGFPLKDYRSVNGSTVVRGIHQKLNIIKEEMKRPCKNSSNAQKIRKREARTLPDRKDTESDSEYYSEEFSENDIYSTTYCGFDVAKEKEKMFKSGSKNYKEYCKEIEKSNVLPRKMGFQGKKEDKGNMFLKSFYIGNTYADPFSKGIKDLDTLQKINLSRCGLKDEGFIKIIKNAPDNLQELDISGNSNLGLKCYEELAKLLDKRENELTTLNLENNEAGNTAIKMLMEPLIYNDTLKCLNINKNGITDIGARYITEMINLNNSISVLLMNWNKILSKGGISVCSAVESNKNIQVFDISFNNIGSKEDSKMANTLKKLFLNNKTLVHVDFSHCKFTTNELKIMNEGLKENHSILGIHMVGNKGKIDTLGFINPEDDSDIAITHIASRLSSELLTGKVKNKEKIKLSA